MRFCAVGMCLQLRTSSARWLKRACAADEIALYNAPSPFSEERDDHRDAQLPAEARLGAGGREPLCRGAEGTHQGFPARRLLSYRSRSAEPDHPLLAL